MRLSFWEKEGWFSSLDFVIIGSGIVGLSAAIEIKNKKPKARVLVLEQGLLPHGASTRNAGFACFGSLSEILADIKAMGEEASIELIKRRWEGLRLLRDLVGDKDLGFTNQGGYDLYKNADQFREAMEIVPLLNRELKSIIGDNVFEDFTHQLKSSGFSNVTNITGTRFEGQVDTGLMMQSLLRIAAEKGVLILNNAMVKNIHDTSNGVELETNIGVSISAKNCIVAVNGFARKLLKMEDVKPARAQVLITRPIEKLPFSGSYHFQEGYYYFRNVGNRLLFGGGRCLDLAGEETMSTSTSQFIQENLERLIHEMILPGINPEIEMRWAGIMGTGNDKNPIVKPLSNHVFCGVRLGGMGVAIGSLVGRDLANMALQS